MAEQTKPQRIASVDQFRGYTMFAMFLVNFIGAYAAVHPLFKHHKTYCSYADTVMPQFFFIMGFAYRLTFLKRVERDGPGRAYRHAVARNIGLIILGAVVYHLDVSFESWGQLKALGLWGFLSTAFRSSLFQALVHIGFTALWILPVISRRTRVLVLFLTGSGLLHLLLSHLFYYDWALSRKVIDGGPLGFMSWTIPTLAGALACDIIRAKKDAVKKYCTLAFWAFALMVLGYAISCLNAVFQVEPPDTWKAFFVEPPFVPPSRPVDIWTMSQQAGSISYLTFSAGFSMILYLLFAVACDMRGLQAGIFRTFGKNPLAGYLIHMLVAEAIQPLVPRDAPLLFLAAGTTVYCALIWLFLRSLEKRRIFFRM